MIVLIGASASGKTEIAKILTKEGLKKTITTTTRDKRVNEVNGIDYHFVSKEEFNNLLLKNSFVEVTNYQNNFYGTNKSDIKEDGLVIVDPNGANAIYEVFGKNVFIVFIKSNKKIREKRMLLRKDSLEDIKIRLKNDDSLFKRKNIRKINLVLKNDNKTLEELASIIKNKYEDWKKRKL